MRFEKISDSKELHKPVILESQHEGAPATWTQINRLEEANEILLLRLKDAESELAHTKLLLDRLDIANIVKPISDEEEIASIQLQKIKLLSRERALSLEEIKMYDLLVKNLKLAKGEVTDIQGHKSLSKTSKPDLIRLAATKK